MSKVALDSSVAIPLLMRSHPEHRTVRRLIGTREVSMTGHSLAETYSVLTRLPGDARLLPSDAARLLSTGFAAPMLLDPIIAADLPQLLAAHGVAGGAVYDAMIARSVKGGNVTLLTRDQRAAATYAALEVEFEFV